ncbi:MAG: SIS domain-containing protein [Anaerolineales bacterium]|nr:SIS domain-containing protein [Anaerolineales bacterium]
MTSSHDHATYTEIKSQTDAWAQALEVTRAVTLPDPEKYEQVVFTGCGSTYYLSMAASATYQELTGRSARAVPGGELLLNSQIILTSQKTLLVAISRSGTTTETVKAVEKFKKENRGDVIVISNYDEVLSKFADVNIIIPSGQEESVAQTRSFASMFVAATAMCARMAGRDDLLDAMSALPEAGQRIMRDFEPAAREIGENLNFDRFYFLGSGIRYGLACEVNLKMKEMTLTHSEPFHFMEFRHGPMSMVNENAVVIGMVSESNYSHEKAVLNEMQALGGKIVALAESNADVSFMSQIPEQVRGVLYLPALQLMAYYRSLAKGLNPDRPTNLTAVVKLNL